MHGQEARVAEYPDINGHYLRGVEAVRAAFQSVMTRRDRSADVHQRTGAEETAGQDYYDAVVTIGTTQARRNWKLRDSLRNVLTEEFIKAGKPIMAYSLINSGDLGRQEFDALQFAEDNAEVLENDDFGGLATGAKAMSATTNSSLMIMNIFFGTVYETLPRTTRLCILEGCSPGTFLNLRCLPIVRRFARMETRNWNDSPRTGAEA